MTGTHVRTDPGGTQAPASLRWARASGHSLRHDRVLQTAVALIVVQLAFRAWATYGSWFHIDDFNFVSRMITSGPDPVTASRSYYGHVMPAAMYLSWLNHVTAPWNWALPATELVVMQAVANVGMLLLLRSLVGWRPGILPPLALFLFSAIAVPPSLWWAAAVNLMPLEIALAFGLLLHLRYLRTNRFRYAVGTNLVILAGLTFNEKTVLVYGAIGIVTLCYFSSGTGMERVRRALAGRWAAVGMYAATLVAYTLVYVPVADDLAGTSDLGHPTYEVARNMILHAYVPGLVGGPLRWWMIPDQPGSLANPGDGVILAACVAVGLLLREILRTRSRAARALLLPGFFLLVDTVLVLMTRAQVAGPAISLEYRYLGELPAVTAIALACATMPIPGATQSAAVRRPSELLDHPRRVTVAVVVVAALGCVSSLGYIGHWQADHQAERYVRRLLPQLESAAAPIPLVDATVPLFVTTGTRYPENTLSHLFHDHTSSMDLSPTATDHLFMVDDRGEIVPAFVPDTRRGRPGPHASCGYRVRTKPVTVKLDGPVGFGGWWIRIGYIASAGSPVRVTAGDVSHNTLIEPGLHALYLSGGGAFDRIEISGLEKDVTMCTNDVTVGRIVPRTDYTP